MNTEWILVASREQARIFSRRGVGPVSLVCEMGNPYGMARMQDLESDRPGRSTDNRMRARHAYSTEENAKDRALRNFYREVLERLEKGAYQHDYDVLTLVAEPRLLGILRPLLSHRVEETVWREIPKDLSFVEDSALLQRL